MTFVERLETPARWVRGHVEITLARGLAVAEVSRCSGCGIDTTWAVAHLCLIAARTPFR